MTLSHADADVGKAGMAGELEPWLAFNKGPGLLDEEGRQYVSAFPPADLMELTTTERTEIAFTEHGVTCSRALSAASPVPLNKFARILDFGCGVGRLARMFKGFSGEYVGVDVHQQSIEWMQGALPYVEAYQTTPRQPLPFPDNHFDCVVSISVFTHMNEADQRFYLSELKRVTKSGGTLLLTVHGYRALSRAVNEERIFQMMNTPREELELALTSLADGSGFHFYNQMAHLSSEAYEYGITFSNRNYLQRVWGEYFNVLNVVAGGIHDFQDIVVLEAR
ncbi:class I SAM-dependent methyltransferase [Sphingomonas prati]|uniref:SAM-dependent methyltransferase n=1 Tax=Sphingomonas prati TaxID=1843237 RepID=A0A7W9F043_9SPHN|nr:class I SAM-dependent methyltransferase [Sphingomonas prati]MBB5727936.1 SAM-dependent methyltransferase [Sphingomonas prati]GGE81989.1 hypothetical protein GCM10011404_13280 [Sphingomonas prati]